MVAAQKAKRQAPCRSRAAPALLGPSLPARRHVEHPPFFLPQPYAQRQAPGSGVRPDSEAARRLFMPISGTTQRLLTRLRDRLRTPAPHTPRTKLRPARGRPLHLRSGTVRESPAVPDSQASRPHRPGETEGVCTRPFRLPDALSSQTTRGPARSGESFRAERSGPLKSLRDARKSVPVFGGRRARDGYLW